jgi:predicted nucleic acid-binding protein
LSAYFDSSVLIKSYVPETDSAVADTLISKVTDPIPFTHFHAIEVRTALRLKNGRGEITGSELKRALAALSEDIDAGRLKMPAYDLATVFHEAERLSDKFAAATFVRSLDILHVATAVVIRATEFITFDTRQTALASKAGLKTRNQGQPAVSAARSPRMLRPDFSR